MESEGATAALLAVEDLRIDTDDGDAIVEEVSLTLEPGRVLALVGESGCGKTSTAMALLAHARPGTRIVRGSVRLAGTELLGLSGRALRGVRGAQIAYMQQDPSTSLNPRHRIGTQITEPLVAHGLASDDPRGRVSSLLEHVGLPGDRGFQRRYPFELSGGQQQRVALAMALAAEPRVVVLDEPTTGLDVTTQARILTLLRHLSDETGIAFVYVSHDLAVVDGLADDVAVMYAGRVIEHGPRSRVFAQPAHPYTALLLASVPRLAMPGVVEGIPGTAPRPGARPQGCAFRSRCPIVDESRCDALPPSVEIDESHAALCWHPSAFEASVRETTSDAAVGIEEGRLLTADGLFASYGRGDSANHVLKDVTLRLDAGDCVALVGESGSGKSTLGRCIAGLHKPDAGTLTLNGEPLAGVAHDRSREHRRAIQVVFQNPNRSLNPRETAFQAVARPLRLFDQLDGQSPRQRVRELLDRVRLPEQVLDRYPRELSGGEKQRLAVARALAARPTVLICDEITSALDVSIQAAIVSLLHDLQAETSLGMLFISHDLAVVNSIADRIVVLEQGVVREHGATREILAQPAHSYTRELIAAAPELRVVGR